MARLEQPALNPAMLGLPTEDDAVRDHVLLSGISDPVIEYQLDAEALRAATTVVIAAGRGNPQLASGFHGWGVS